MKMNKYSLRVIMIYVFLSLPLFQTAQFRHSVSNTELYLPSNINFKDPINPLMTTANGEISAPTLHSAIIRNKLPRSLLSRPRGGYVPKSPPLPIALRRHVAQDSTRLLVESPHSSQLDSNKNNNDIQHSLPLTLSPLSTGETQLDAPHTSQLQPLTAMELVLCGAVSRTLAALLFHPLNLRKIHLQLQQHSATPLLPQPLAPLPLTRGLGTQLLLSLPHGALNFAVTEKVKKLLLSSARDSSKSSPSNATAQLLLDPAMDLLAASVASLVCSAISTPQMLLTDRIMVGMYPGLQAGVREILRTQGLRGFYQGWLPGIMLKIPSYSLTWTFFRMLRKRAPRSSDLVLASLAASASCSLMVPMDTVKTRLIMQQQPALSSRVKYSGIFDCFRQILQQEGLRAFYVSLPPRVLSIAPMIGIQFSTYEFLKSSLLLRKNHSSSSGPRLKKIMGFIKPNKSPKEKSESISLRLPTSFINRQLHKIRGGITSGVSNFRSVELFSPVDYKNIDEHNEDERESECAEDSSTTKSCEAA